MLTNNKNYVLNIINCLIGFTLNMISLNLNTLQNVLIFVFIVFKRLKVHTLKHVHFLKFKLGESTYLYKSYCLDKCIVYVQTYV